MKRLSDNHQQASAVFSTETESIRELDILEFLRHRGYLISQQRLAFIYALCTLKEISDPEEFWLYLKEKNIMISIASVYNILRMMIKEKLILKEERIKGCHRYRLTDSLL